MSRYRLGPCAAWVKVGDSGEEQRLIRTFARKGFRFVAEVADRCDEPASIGAERGPEPAVAKPDSGGDQQEAVPPPPRRASIAVMPFLDRSGAARVRGGAGDALAHDVITRLAKLRSLFVIAQGTVFALRERGIGTEEAGLLLKVDYLASGSVRRAGKRITPGGPGSPGRARRALHEAAETGSPP